MNARTRIPAHERLAAQVLTECGRDRDAAAGLLIRALIDADRGSDLADLLEFYLAMQADPEDADESELIEAQYAAISFDELAGKLTSVADNNATEALNARFPDDPRLYA